ncbi:MAG: SMC-Scp complex subunit ScpB [Pseudomonadota bacterium]
MSEPTLEKVLEVVLLAAGRPLKLEELIELLVDSPLNADRASVREALSTVGEQWADRGMELSEVASGYRLQVNAGYSPWVARLQAERPARYSRALLETLALIAYRQPITRGEIEDVRGVSVSASIVRTLVERDWIRVLGQRDVPGRPSIYGTTRTFLDDFNLKGLDDLPPLADVRDIDKFHTDLFAEQVDETRHETDDTARDGATAPEPDSPDTPVAAGRSDSVESPSAASVEESEQLAPGSTDVSSTGYADRTDMTSGAGEERQP